MDTEGSAALRDQLAAELKGIRSADEAARWAHRVLGAKSTLTAADAKQIEDEFQTRLPSFESAVEDLDVGLSRHKPPPQRASSYRGRRRKAVSSTGAESIDKSELTHPEPRRVRDREHVRFVAKQACLICGRRPSDPHHLRFAQCRALGRKVSDEFTVPLCRGHHREVHRCGDEAAWWQKAGIDPTACARALWLQMHPLPTRSEATSPENTGPAVALGETEPIAARGPNYKMKPIRLPMTSFRQIAANSRNAAKSTGPTTDFDFARCFLRLANLPNFALDRLSRYEATLWRQAAQTLFALD